MAARKKKVVAKKKAAAAPRVPKPKLLRTDSAEFDADGNPTAAPTLTVGIEGTDKAMTVDLGSLPVRIKIRAALDGIFAKARASKDPLAVLQGIVEGVWPEGRRAAGPGRISMVVEALAKVSGRSVEECKEVWAAADAETRKRIQADVRVKQAVVAIRAQRSGATASGLEELFKAPPAPQEAPAAGTATETAPAAAAPSQGTTAPPAAGLGAPPPPPPAPGGAVPGSVDGWG